MSFGSAIEQAQKAAAKAAARVGNQVKVEFEEYIDRPVEFAQQVLNLRLWSHQAKSLQAIVENRRVAWRTGHGIGKTLVAAVAVAWFLCTRPQSLAIMSAPSYRQVKSVDWRTLDSVMRGASVALGGEFFDSPEHGWKFPDGRLAIGFSAANADALAGFHGRRVLVVVDEASGFETELFSALKGALTGDSRLLLIGNPVRTSGEFYSAFQPKSKYFQLHTSAYDSPNITLAEPKIEGLIDQEWISEMEGDYGAESAVFSSRVLGEFPKQAADCVISLALVESAKERWLEFKRPGAAPFRSLGRLEMGVDVARFGDDETCITVRRGHVALEPITFRGLPVTTVAEKVAAIAVEHSDSGERALVRVDTVGVGGGVADILRRQYSNKLTVVDVNAGASPRNPTYMRCRDELLFSLRDWLRNGGAIPPDSKLEGELCAPTYSYSPSQKIAVESKDETKKRIRRSPDRMDSLSLAVYSAKEALHYYNDNWHAVPPNFGSHTEAVADHWGDSPTDGGTILWEAGGGKAGF